MTALLQPTTTAELAEAVVSAPRLRVVGSGSRLAWVKPFAGSTVSTTRLSGIVDLRPEDGVAVVKAGTMVEDLLLEVAGHGLTLPLAVGLPREVAQRHGTVGGLVATGLPHGHEAAFGPVRDWVLGLTVVRGDGSVCKVGSQVLKSVAGFDIHRFGVGSRGGLFAIAEVVLRLRRVSTLEPPQVQVHSPAPVTVVGRMLPDHLQGVLAKQAGVVASDPSGLFWTSEPITAELGPGWWIGPGGTRSRVQNPSLELAAKETIDPDARFETGWVDA